MASSSLPLSADGGRRTPRKAPRVVIVGAGVAGAGAAHKLRRERPDLEVVVLEAAPRAGGKLAVAEVGGVVTDVGAEALLARRPEATDLIHDAGLGDDLVHPRTLAARLWNRGTLVPLPRSLMGVPRSVTDLDGVLSDAGLHAAREQTTVPALADDEDVSVGDLVARHLGEEVVQRMVEPMLGGVYAGHAHALSARAAVAGLVKALDGRRTLTEAADEAMSSPPPGETPPPVFAGLVGGVGRLPSRVLADSGADLRAGVTVRGLRRTVTGWALETGSTRDAEVVEADAVVLAVPAAAAARLLVELAPAASADLAGIEYASMAVITLAFRADDLPPGLADGSGFLTPPVDGHPVKGATWSFAKWQWVADAGDAGTDRVRLLRCSIGRHREEQQLQRSDAELVALARADLRAAAGITGTPVDTHVQRWGGGLPQYAVGHVARVARIRSAVGSLPGLAVCGAAYDGVGVPAVLASSYSAADRVLEHLALAHPSGR